MPLHQVSIVNRQLISPQVGAVSYNAINRQVRCVFRTSKCPYFHLLAMLVQPLYHAARHRPIIKIERRHVFILIIIKCRETAIENRRNTFHPKYQQFFKRLRKVFI